MFSISYKDVLKIIAFALPFAITLTLSSYYISFNLFPFFNDINSLYTGLPLSYNMFFVLNFFGFFLTIYFIEEYA